MSAPSDLTVLRLGRVEYEDGLRLQEVFGRARKEDLVGDTLLLLEHPPVLTLGRAARRQNILFGDAALAAQGVEVFETNRGGDVTYHGPGQVVGYPIFKLLPGRQDVRRYVRDVEEAMIRTAADYGLRAGRMPKWPGVWLGKEQDPDARKLAAIGVHIARWQTSHGFAFNVNTNLGHFGLIIPCGIREKGVTSLEQELGRKVPLTEVEAHLGRHFGDIFDKAPTFTKPQKRTVSVVVTRGEEVLLLRRTPERGGFWQPVTGRMEEGETPFEAATRELAEETGLELSPAPLDYVHSFAFGDAVPPQVIEEHAFHARLPEDAQVRVDPTEHDEAAFFPRDEALSLLPFKGLKVAVQKALDPVARARL